MTASFSLLNHSFLKINSKEYLFIDFILLSKCANITIVQFYDPMLTNPLHSQCNKYATTKDSVQEIFHMYITWYKHRLCTPNITESQDLVFILRWYYQYRISILMAASPSSVLQYLQYLGIRLGKMKINYVLETPKCLKIAKH